MRDLADIADLQRARGRVEVAVSFRDGGTRLDRLYQQGCAKARLPRPGGPAPEVVLINTAGGVTGGDRLACSLSVGAGAALVATTQTAERVYRSAGGSAAIDNRLSIGEGAALDWLPQETILFDGGRLSRTLHVEMAADAGLLALETLVLGRAARGETVTRAGLADHWRIRRGGSLIHAEALRLDGDVAAATAGAATLAGARALATLVSVGPDAGARLDVARRLLAGLPAGVAAAASAKSADVLVVRLLGQEARPLRDALIRFLMGFRDAPLPRVWTS